jgi:hypothetical protein
MSGTYLAQPRACPDESVKGNCFFLTYTRWPRSRIRSLIKVRVNRTGRRGGDCRGTLYDNRKLPD